MPLEEASEALVLLGGWWAKPTLRGLIGKVNGCVE